MMRLSIIIFICSCLGACDSELVTPSLDYDVLRNALLNYEEELVIQEITKLTSDLEPKSGDHTNNFNTLIERIGSQNLTMTAELGCYVCIETAPPQSEIIIHLDSVGTQVLRTIDVLTPTDAVLECVGMHH